MRFFFCLVSCWCLIAHADLTLNITQSAHHPTPIVFESTPTTHATWFLDRIREDFQHSGAFQVQKEGALYRILIDAVRGKDHTIDVHVRVQSALEDAVPKRYHLYGQETRALAHQVSDVIYQEITGTRGIFSLRLAYVSLQRKAGFRPIYRLIVSDVDGFNPHAIVTSTEPLMSPAWSPDGQRMAYVSFEGQRARIFLQNLATGQRTVIQGVSGLNSAPAWSPDGKTLALVLTKRGFPHVYLLDVVSRRLQQITHGRFIDTEPAWDVDGQSILFTSDRQGSPTLYRYTVATRQVKRVMMRRYATHAQPVPSRPGAFVFVGRDANGFVLMLKEKASQAARILSHDRGVESPSVSPNGQWIMYATRHAGQGVLGMVSLHTGVRGRLPSGLGDVYEPVFSPYVTSN